MFEILDRAYLARMRRERGFGVNPWRTHSRFLVSHNLLIDPTYADPLREWLESTPTPGTLLILDEAHHAAPASGGRYGIETKFTRAEQTSKPTAPPAGRSAKFPGWATVARRGTLQSAGLELEIRGLQPSGSSSRPSSSRSCGGRRAGTRPISASTTSATAREPRWTS